MRGADAPGPEENSTSRDRLGSHRVPMVAMRLRPCSSPPTSQLATQYF